MVFNFFFSLPLPGSKVNATLFVARIHSALLLFWCRADGTQVSPAREGQELLQDAEHTNREKISPKIQEKANIPLAACSETLLARARVDQAGQTQILLLFVSPKPSSTSK